MSYRCFFFVIVFFFSLGLADIVHAETPLEISMKHMSKALKELSLDLQQPQEASKSDYLVLSSTLKTEAQTSRDLTPKKVATLPANRQDAMVKAYRKSMDDLLGSIDSLSQDLQNSKWDDALKDVATIKKQETDGHKSFRIKKIGLSKVEQQNGDQNP